MADAPARILDAAIASLVSAGAGALAMHEVAERAGVSKGLIHYHFRDKDALLQEAAGRIGARISGRERRALSASTAATVVDDLRAWIEEEIAAGEWRALLALSQWPHARVTAAAATALGERRTMAAASASRLLALLGLRSRVALEQVAEMLVAAISGLAVTAPTESARRDACDVLLLAILSLSE